MIRLECRSGHREFREPDAPCGECARQRELASIREAAKADAAKKAVDNHVLSPRFRDRTLGNFQVYADPTNAKDQRRALAACDRFIAAFPRHVGLAFIGGPGTGKNHLASGIANALIALRGKSFTACVTTAYRLIVDLKAAWDRREDEHGQRIGPSHQELLTQLQNLDLLVVDELGVEFGSETDIMLLTHLFNARYEWLRPTIFCGNMTPLELRARLGDRIISRMHEGRADGDFVIVCDWPDYRRHPKNGSAA